MWTTNNYVKKNVSKKSNLIFLYNTTNNNSTCYSNRFFIKIITLTCNLFNLSSSMKHKVILLVINNNKLVIDNIFCNDKDKERVW